MGRIGLVECNLAVFDAIVTTVLMLFGIHPAGRVRRKSQIWIED